MNPLVSVVVPTYNRAGTLGDCLGSILAQTYVPLEVIVVDDGSTDGTADTVAERYGGRVRCERIAHSGLPAVARNRGIAFASGALLAFCDSDDAWEPDKIRRQVAALERTGANFACSDASVHGTGGQGYLSAYRFRTAGLQASLVWENFVILSSVLLDRAVLGTHRFAVDPWLRGYEDYDLWLRLLPGLRIVFDPDRLVRYGRSGGSLSEENRPRDAAVQFRLIWRHRALARSPGIWTLKVLRTMKHLLR